ncbi:MAG: hypothetical protein HOW73_26320 [Polyangiaceae bacterium]|nr:hypothetical protein [Polyangiaceae bacterium]
MQSSHSHSLGPGYGWWAVLFLSFVACADGSDDEASTSTTGGGVPWTTSTGAGGAGGTASQGGAPQGGAGGQTSSGGSGGAGGDGGQSTSTGGTGQGGMGGMGEGGMADDGQLVLMALGDSGVFAGSFTPSTGWDTETLAGDPIDPSARPAVVMRGPDDALALFRGDAGALAFSTFDGLGWSMPDDVGAAITTRAAPSVTANAAQVFAVFQGDDFKHYFAVYTASFNPDDEMVGNPQSFGPFPASIALASGQPIVTFAGDNHDLFDQTRTGGTWGAASPHGLANVFTTPAIVPLDQGPELLVVFNRQDSTIAFTTRTAGVWSSPADLPDALTTDPVTLAPMAGGRAVAAFRGTNGMAYASVYDPSGAPVWSDPVGIAAAATPTPPAVATGAGGADAELVYVSTQTGSAMHSRLVSGQWSNPASIGGSALGSVAIAARP